MTKTNEKIHVLADESLGGIKREYVEVDRKAEEGEKIVIVDKRYPGDIYENGDIFTVDREAPPGSGFVECGEATSGMNCGGLIYLGEYRVLEPTNIVHIDGPDGTERYEMVDREAEVGEKVIHLSELYSDGTVTEVTSVGAGMVDVIEYEDSDGDITCGFSHGCYRVLVPAESSEEEPQPSDPIDVIANLATRVAELERENKRIKEDLGWNEMGPGRIAELRNADSDIRHDIAALEEKFEHDRAENEEMGSYVYEEMKRMKDEIDTLHKDNRRHGEELEALKYAAKETDGKVAHLESDSDMRLFTAEEVAALLNAMRERQ
ncbi:hypothetical protein CHCC5027_2641 [Bacillus paralicheniformis]|nr:hypothetical protein CHCC5027_2641 [Bacillus paralicheniformis]